MDALHNFGLVLDADLADLTAEKSIQLTAIDRLSKFKSRLDGSIEKTV